MPLVGAPARNFAQIMTPTILLTLASFLAAAAAFPLAVIVLAGLWPWLLERMPRSTGSSQFLHGLAMAAGAGAGLYLRRSVLGIGDEALGGGIVWFIAITLGVMAYGLSAIILGIRRQNERERERRPFAED